jgi:5-methyltetrahydropteroyltriglutamate--homocysteine methyltransferase
MNYLRAHVVGSMLRPQALIGKLRSYREGRCDPAEFKAIEDQAVDDAIAIQERSGIALITDGEQRRLAFADVMATSMGLQAEKPHRLGESYGGMWHGGDKQASELEISNPAGGLIVGKLRRGDSQAAEEFVYLRARASKPAKVTLPSPTMFTAAWAPHVSSGAYPTLSAALDDICEILRQEVHALARLGCRYVQFDAPEVTFAINPDSSPVLKASGMSQESYCQMVVDRLCDVAIEPGVTFSVHFCRGNARGLWHSAGGYEAISRFVFPRLGPFTYVLLEYDSERAGGFGALADLAPQSCAVLGLITTKSGQLEDPAVIKAQINEAAKVIPLERLALSPQCGFASDAGGNPLDRAQQNAKLGLVGRLAAEIWP